jgi:hypothetical protein
MLAEIVPVVVIGVPLAVVNPIPVLMFCTVPVPSPTALNDISAMPAAPGVTETKTLEVLTKFNETLDDAGPELAVTLTELAALFARENAPFA